MKVDQTQIWIDDEDEYLGVLAELDCLEWKYGLPKWAYLPSEWSTYVVKKTHLQRRLRKLQEKLGYTNTVAE